MEGLWVPEAFVPLSNMATLIFPTFRHYLLFNGHAGTGGPAQSLELLAPLPFSKTPGIDTAEEDTTGP